MKNFGFIFITFFFLMTIICPYKSQGAINTYKDKNGITVISNDPVPEEYQEKAKTVETFESEELQENGFRKFYEPFGKESEYSGLQYLKKGSYPKIYSSENLLEDAKILSSKNFLLIGISSFSGPMGTEKQLLDQARRIKATMVLVQTKHIGTDTETIPWVVPNFRTTYHSGSIYGSGGGSAWYSGSSSTFDTTVIPITIQQQRYGQAALYFVKNTKKYKFGIRFDDLKPEQRASLKQNTGIVVVIVMEDSPAFLTNVLPGDILIEFGGITIRNKEHFSKLLDSAALNNRYKLKVIREGVNKTIFIQL